MRHLLPLLAVMLIAGCGPQEPGTASEAEAEALNRAAATLDAQPTPANASGR